MKSAKTYYAGATTSTFASTALVLILALGAPFWMACAKKPTPPLNSGFLEDYGQMAPRPERFPFDAVWISPKLERRQYQNVLIRRVDTAHLQGVDWSRDQPSTEHSFEVRREANGLAKHAWDSIRSSFYYDPNRALTVVDRPRDQTAIFELSITRVILGSFGGGTVAMEGRLRDGDSNEILATFMDQKTGNRRDIVEKWALQLVELVNTPVTHKVEE